MEYNRIIHQLTIDKLQRTYECLTKKRLVSRPYALSGRRRALTNCSQFSQRSRLGSTKPPSWASKAANQQRTWVPASLGITRTFAAAASDWRILLPNSVAPSTRIETFGWTEYISANSKRLQYRIAAFFLSCAIERNGQFNFYKQCNYLWEGKIKQTMKISYESAVLFHFYASFL